MQIEEIAIEEPPAGDLQSHGFQLAFHAST